MAKVKKVDTNNVEFKYVQIKNIVLDENQPRKHFSESDLQELAESIKQKGVLQPVLVRPLGDHIQLVYGERRLRASKIAGMETVPAIVRTLSDDEAFEIQIMENLQRKDVEPMEEASAFLRMREKGIDIESIALKIGKYPRYVALRLTLNNLIEAFQKMLFQKHLTLKDAYRLAVLPSSSQTEMLNNSNYDEDEPEMSEQWRPYGGFSKTEKDLDKATWDMEDVFLYPSAGACLTCQHNTGANTLLFQDEKPRCLNPSCFQEKKRLQYKHKLDKLAEDTNCIFVVDLYYIGEEEKALIKLAESTGKSVINIDDDRNIKKIEDPGEVDPFETWADYNEDYVDFDREEDEEKWTEMMKPHYETYAKEHNDKVQEYRKKMSSGGVVKAFVVAGRDMGNEIYIEMSSSLEKAVDKTGSESSKEAIAKLESREKRAEQLDRDKIYKEFVKRLGASDSFKGNASSLTKVDMQTASLALYTNLGYSSVRDSIAKTYGLGSGYSENEYNLIRKMTDVKLVQLFNVLVRAFVFNKLSKPESCEADWTRFQNDKAMYDIADKYIQPELLEIQDVQYKVRENRKSKVQKRINSLKN